MEDPQIAPIFADCLRGKARRAMVRKSGQPANSIRNRNQWLNNRERFRRLLGVKYPGYFVKISKSKQRVGSAEQPPSGIDHGLHGGARIINPLKELRILFATSYCYRKMFYGSNL